MFEKSTPIIVIKTRHNAYQVSLADLMKKLGIEEPAEELGMMVKQGDKMLYASTLPYASEYVGINVDGEVENHDAFYLAKVELPNESYPSEMVARLYAGAASYETDGPIAMVKHKCDDAELTFKRAGEDKGYTKIVYVDTDVAQYRPWNESRPMPEHAED